MQTEVTKEIQHMERITDLDSFLQWATFTSAVSKAFIPLWSLLFPIDLGHTVGVFSPGLRLLLVFPAPSLPHWRAQRTV